MDPIGPLQLKVMHHIWGHGPSTVREVHDALMADPQAKRLAYTTILAVMRNLARRGLLAQRRQRQGGLAHRFSSRVERSGDQQAAIRHLRCGMFRGDLRAMLAAVAADTELSPADRRRIRGGDHRGRLTVMSATPPLSEAEVARALAALPGWRHDAGALRKNFRFSDFRGAIAFIQEAAVDVDRLDHHPTWTNTYNRVDVVLTTHDSGDQVTAKDVQVARAIELATNRVRPSIR